MILMLCFSQTAWASMQPLKDSLTTAASCVQEIVEAHPHVRDAAVAGTLMAVAWWIGSREVQKTSSGEEAKGGLVEKRDGSRGMFSWLGKKGRDGVDTSDRCGNRDYQEEALPLSVRLRTLSIDHGNRLSRCQRVGTSEVLPLAQGKVLEKITVLRTALLHMKAQGLLVSNRHALVYDRESKGVLFVETNDDTQKLYVGCTRHLNEADAVRFCELVTNVVITGLRTGEAEQTLLAELGLQQDESLTLERLAQALKGFCGVAK